MKSIYIYGASGHGLVVADIAKACGYENIKFIDDGKNEYLCFEDIQKEKKVPIALGIGNNHIRAKLFEKIQNSGLKIVSLIHPSSIISSSVYLGKGIVVMPNVVINANTIVKEGVILNTSCVIEHDCIVEPFVHISPKVALAGNVNIGQATHIGIGTNIIQGITIGRHCLVGAGSTVVIDISNFKKAYGTPCKEVEDLK